jgi:hypothetical protein
VRLTRNALPRLRWQTAAVETRKLTSTNGFVMLDAPEAEVSVGPTRLGAKLIPGNAENFARHLTYVFGVLGEKKAGATVGLKVEPADAAEAVAAFAEEFGEELAAQRLLTSAGLRLNNDSLAPVLAHDQRNKIGFDDRDGISFEDELLGVGAATAVAHVLGGSDVRSLEGRRVAIEGFGSSGVAIAREVAAMGGSVARISTAKGTLSGSFDAQTLASAFAADGPDMVGSLGSPGKPWEIWRGEGIDAIFVTSKPGAMSGEGASSLGQTPVIPIGTSPITSKALAILRKAGAPVVADFVTSIGPALSWWPQEGADHDALRLATGNTVSVILDEVGGHEQGSYLGACHKAEAFMSTWMEKLPFGRPLG